jgi:Zn-finger protein
MTENLALVGGNPSFPLFSCHFILFVCLFCFCCVFQDKCMLFKFGGSVLLWYTRFTSPIRYCISGHIGDNVSF